MPTLTERLKAMGVKVGAKDLPAPKPHLTFPVEEVVAGRFIEMGGGSTFLIEQDFSNDYHQGEIGLRITSSSRFIAEWAGNITIADRDPESLVFLDTETSGLAGGTGTFAFLVGVGRYTPSGFHLAQFFMRDPLEEPALLLALEEFLAACQTVVSFNGKAFDVPLLDTRYTLQGWKSPFKELSQVDLLHLARRLWRDRLPSRTLANLEVQILHVGRTDEEIPGWMIPEIYFEYLRDGDARPLQRVFYHNAMDVVSLAALLNHTTLLLDDPFFQPRNEYIELAAVARLMEDLGHLERAVELYEACLKAELPDEVFDDTLYRLSFLHKRHDNFPAAIPLWKQAAARRQVYAYEELAKYYEHHVEDLEQALHWTQKALAYLDSSRPADVDKIAWKPEFEHRLERLKRKNSGRTDKISKEAP
jgi:uncharacterized protein YprB with RNaseH-like and TPR domain